MLYFQGAWELSETRCVAVVGSRTASEDGIRRATRVAHALVDQRFTVVSGLAAGVDKAAHTAAIEAGGKTVAFIGTPIGTYYPKENEALQRRIAEEHLLISQVPVLRYAMAASRSGDWIIEIVKRNELHKFVVLPKRWIVERSIAWLNRCRRLAKDWENLSRKALAFLHLASIRLMLRKLCNPA